jgi:glyoxylase-like metal-dependent hydrolase (beta-lactamase superfamily II)
MATRSALAPKQRQAKDLENAMVSGAFWMPSPGLYNLHGGPGKNVRPKSRTSGELSMAAPQIHTLVSMPFQENTYVVWLPPRQEVLVVDPGLEPQLILDFLEERGLTPAAILNTHGHADHIGGNAALKAAFPAAPLIIGVNEQHLLTDARANVSALFGMPITSPPADRTVREGDVLEEADVRLEVLEVPGHSPGHVVYLYRDNPSLVFGGDVLFRGSIGRHDFPGSNGPLLFDGIRRKLFSLPPDTVVYPGHGPVTTIGQEKRFNPFVGDSADLPA